MRQHRLHTYRFVFLPETIGSIAYLWLRCETLRRRCIGGYVVTCCGDAGALTYQASKRIGTATDKIAVRALARLASRHHTIPFRPDEARNERGYNNPGFDLPVGSLMRITYGRYPECRTSLDDKSVLSFPALRETVDMLEAIIDGFEHREQCRLAVPPQPQLGRRRLFLSDPQSWPQISRQYCLLNHSDGTHDLEDIAEVSSHQVEDLAATACTLVEARLLPRDGSTA